MRNVLDCFPKRMRAEAAEQLKKIPYAATLAECDTSGICLLIDTGRIT